jgi:2-oxoisovalerate dehydrogenase E2 component (dihydrolipoyl transacylase)
MTRVELTSPTIGVVKRLGAAEGVVLKVGEVVCDIETEGESEEVSEEVSENTKEPEVEKTTPTPTQAQAQAQGTPAKKEESKEDESLHQSRDDILDNSGGAQFSGEAAMLPSPPPATIPSHASAPQVAREERREKQPWSELRKIVKASPAVRTLAARMGIELVDVKGSGEGGRVLRDDLTSHSVPASHSYGESRNEVGMGGRDRSGIPEVTRVEFGRTRKVMYRAMGDMGQVPHFG